MKTIGLNNKEYKLPLHKYLVHYGDIRSRSKLHVKARGIIDDIYHGYSVYEEVKLPGTRSSHLKSALFLDFLIPSIMLAVEVNGKQHYEYCQYFHKNISGFKKSQKLDIVKEEWCDLNGITLVQLKYSDNGETWRRQLEHF